MYSLNLFIEKGFLMKVQFKDTTISSVFVNSRIVKVENGTANVSAKEANMLADYIVNTKDVTKDEPAETAVVEEPKKETETKATKAAE